MSAKTNKYPWETWTDGEVHGVRFSGDSEEDAVTAMERTRNSIYVHGKRNGMATRTLIDYEPNGILLRFQILPKGEESKFSALFVSEPDVDVEFVTLDDLGQPVPS